ncbi:MAG: hypothetical protein V2J14_09470, partial [Erythrobacter sp.]|nr:hypothetical protein [Erythrobacter sp.]
MIRLAFTLGAAALAFAAPVAATAQDLNVERKAIELKNLQKGKDTLDPAKGYIFVNVPNRINAMFMKTPDADDVAAFEAEWNEAFAKAREKYEKRIVAYERKAERGTATGEKPEEPTPETFSIGQIESRLMFSVGPQYVFDKGNTPAGDKFFHYLHQVEPGIYTYYGPLFFDPNQGALGSCYCMGSFKFEVKAGEITSLGDFLTDSWADDAALKQANVFFEPDPDRVQKPTDWSVPATLAALPAAEADLRAAGKMNNFYRVSVLRSPPIPGVLRYERDTVIDVKAEIAAAEAEAKAKAEAEALAKAQAEAAA